VDNN